MTPLKIDIVSDVSCPWCIIGYQSLNAAIKEAGLSDSVELNWHPFELNPGMAPEGKAHADYARDKYGHGPEQREASFQNVTNRAAAVGYEINFPEQPRIYNTFDAHRLIHWAKEFDQQTELKLSLFKLFFQDHGNPSAEADLLGCVKAVGLDVNKAKEILNSDLYKSDVQAALTDARQKGITSVPTYIFDEKYVVTGGQPKDTFIKVFEAVGAAS